MTISWMHINSRGTHVYTAPVVLYTYCINVRVTRRRSWFGNLTPSVALQGHLFRKLNVLLHLLCNALDLPYKVDHAMESLCEVFFFTGVLCR